MGWGSKTSFFFRSPGFNFEKVQGLGPKQQLCWLGNWVYTIWHCHGLTVTLCDTWGVLDDMLARALDEVAVSSLL